jgi:hypothetical protein
VKKCKSNQQSIKLGTPVYIPERIPQHTTHLGYTHIYIKYVYMAAPTTHN